MVPFAELVAMKPLQTSSFPAVRILAVTTHYTFYGLDLEAPYGRMKLINLLVIMMILNVLFCCCIEINNWSARCV